MALPENFNFVPIVFFCWRKNFRLYFVSNQSEKWNLNHGEISNQDVVVVLRKAHFVQTIVQKKSESTKDMILDLQHTLWQQ